MYTYTYIYIYIYIHIPAQAHGRLHQKLGLGDSWLADNIIYYTAILQYIILDYMICYNTIYCNILSIYYKILLACGLSVREFKFRIRPGQVSNSQNKKFRTRVEVPTQTQVSNSVFPPLPLSLPIPRPLSPPG